jgi:hypothetical protein
MSARENVVRTVIVACLALAVVASTAVAADPPVVRFEMQEIATDLTIGYAVAVADINEDGKPDIVVVDKHRVLWYENPTWKPHVILQGKTKPDNVCLAILDIDGDGHLDIVLGADWAPFNTKAGGTLQWLKRGKTMDEEWTMYPIVDEPTVHRVKVADLDGSGKPQIILAPLMGRESTQKANWMDGRPVRILSYPIPADPVKGPWKSVVLNDGLHVVHNFWPTTDGSGKPVVWCASYEGVTVLGRQNGKWISRHAGAGNQDNPKGNRGSSEIKVGRLANGQHFVATIEPWHGNQVVVYTEEQDEMGLQKRFVIDDHLRWGHGVWCADLDGDGTDEIIIGVRDDPAKDDKFKERRGVRVYKCADGKGEKWTRQIVDDGGVAVEDLTAADLNGDGRVDIIAVGRQTHNLRIYWNKGK